MVNPGYDTRPAFIWGDSNAIEHNVPSDTEAAAAQQAGGQTGVLSLALIGTVRRVPLPQILMKAGRDAGHPEALTLTLTWGPGCWTPHRLSLCSRTDVLRGLASKAAGPLG